MAEQPIWIATANPAGVSDVAGHETSYITKEEMPTLVNWMNKNPIPVYIEHNAHDRIRVGSTVAAEIMQNGELGVGFKLDTGTAMGDLAEVIIDKGHMREVSLGWQIGIHRDPNTKLIAGVATKTPSEISIVKKGDRENTKILGKANDISAYIKESKMTQRQQQQLIMEPQQAQPAIQTTTTPASAPPPAAQPTPAASSSSTPNVEELQRQVQALLEINKQHETRQRELDKATLERIAQKLDSEDFIAFLNRLKDTDQNYRSADSQVRDLIKALKTQNPTVETQALTELLAAAASAHKAEFIRASELEKQVREQVQETKRTKTATFEEPVTRESASTALPSNVIATSERAPPRNIFANPEVSSMLQRYGYQTRSSGLHNQLQKDFSGLYDRIEKAHGGKGTWIDALKLPRS